MFLLSEHPWFSIFSSVLKALEPYSFKLSHADATITQTSPINDVLRALSKTTLPPPGWPSASAPPPVARTRAERSLQSDMRSLSAQGGSSLRHTSLEALGFPR